MYERASTPSAYLLALAHDPKTLRRRAVLQQPIERLPILLGGGQQRFAVGRCVILAREQPVRVDAVVVDDGRERIERGVGGHLVDRHAQGHFVYVESPRDRTDISPVLPPNQPAHSRGNTTPVEL